MVPCRGRLGPAVHPTRVQGKGEGWQFEVMVVAFRKITLSSIA
jgi:hypothetical protein